MKLEDAVLGPVLYIGPSDDGEQALIITTDPHDCGWQERVTYVETATLEILRSGCAGCDAELDVPTKDEARRYERAYAETAVSEPGGSQP